MYLKRKIFERIFMTMKKINYIKFILDLIMGIVFSMLFNKNVLGGLKFHEIAGLAVGFAVLIHIVLNWKWVKNVTLLIFNKKIALKTRIGYILNVLLLLDIAVIIISGIFISKVLFPGIMIQNNFFNQRTHIASAYLGLALIGIHLGLHWKWVMGMLRKVIKVNNTNNILKYIAKVVAVLVLAIGIYSMVAVNYFSKSVQIFGITSSIAFEHNANGGGSVKQSGGNIGISKEIPQHPQNIIGENPHFAYGGKEMGSANIVNVLTTYMSIMGTFTVLTYYIEEFLLKKKRIVVQSEY
jgi:hypothetical protein